MRLLIATPGAVAADVPDVVAVRAEDASGEFGVLPHHADLVTALSVSVLAWRGADGTQGYCAVRGGLLTVSGGQEVRVATREAVPGEDLAELEALVRGRLAAEAQAQRQARSGAEELRLQAIRQIVGYLRAAPDGERRIRP